MSWGTLNALVQAGNFAGAAWSLHGPQRWYRPLETLVAATCLVCSLEAQNWAASAFCVATLILLGWDWWNRRGRKAARQLGAKSLALLAAVVEKLREAGTPVPQGVRA